MYERGNLRASTHGTLEAHSERSGWAHPTLLLKGEVFNVSWRGCGWRLDNRYSTSPADRTVTL